MNSQNFSAMQKVTIAGFLVPVYDTSVINLYLRRYDNNGVYIDEYTGVSVGDGEFRFEFPDGRYQMWKAPYPDEIASNRIDSWHGAPNKYRWFGDEELPYLPSGVDPLDLTDIELQIADAVDTDNPVALGQANTLYYKKSDDPLVFTDVHLSINDASDADEPVSLQQMDAAIASVQGHEQGLRVIRVIPDAIEEVVGEVYQDIYDAVTYANGQTPSLTKQYAIQIEGMGGNQFLFAPAGCIKPYVNIIAAGRHISIVFGEPTISLAAPMTIENATIYFGGNDVITDRVFSKVNLKNVICYHYRDITFNNSDLIHSRIAGSTTKLLKYGGTTNLDYVSLKNEPTKLAGHSGAENYTTFDYSVPIDPSETP